MRFWNVLWTSIQIVIGFSFQLTGFYVVSLIEFPYVMWLLDYGNVAFTWCDDGLFWRGSGGEQNWLSLKLSRQFSDFPAPPKKLYPTNQNDELSEWIIPSNPMRYSNFRDKKWAKKIRNQKSWQNMTEKNSNHVHNTTQTHLYLNPLRFLLVIRMIYA